MSLTHGVSEGLQGPTRMSHKRVFQACPTTASTKGVYKGSPEEYFPRVSQRCVTARHSASHKRQKSVLQENLMKALHKSVSERHVSRGLTGANVLQKSKSKTLTVSFKSVAQACLTRILLQWCLKAPPKKNISEKPLQKVSDTSGFQECLSGVL